MEESQSIGSVMIKQTIGFHNMQNSGAKVVRSSLEGIRIDQKRNPSEA
jgi:hypothetical protein